jgi:hypothetical protein
MAITYREDYDPETQSKHAVPVTVTKFVGRVLRVFQEDYRAMSDIYTMATFATVWDDVLNKTKVVLVNSNFELDTNCGRVEVDADEATLKKFAAWTKKCEEHAEALREASRKAREEEERNRPVVGKKMVVTKGRKVKIGTQGVVFWIRDGRVGLDVTGKKDARGYVVDPVWVTAQNLSAL